MASCDRILSFSIMSSRFIYIVAYIIFHYFLVLENILLNGYILILFIHSSVDGHLNWFPNLAVINNADSHSCVQLFFWGGEILLYIWQRYFSIYLGVKVLSHKLTTHLIFLGTATGFPKWLQHFIFPSAMSSSPHPQYLLLSSKL